MPTSFEEYFGLKMFYKELRAEWKSLEMFPGQMNEEDRMSKRQEKKLIKRLLKTTEK
jgi:hypothetical protein